MKMRAPLLATFLGVLTFQATAFAQAANETVEENRLTQLATLRSTLTNQLHLKAYELIDEMVYELKERPLLDLLSNTMDAEQRPVVRRQDMR